jgi:hypothetical protein
MNTAEDSAYRASFPENARVRLVKGDHSQNFKPAVILRALPNPSRRAEHQWYDVRFDNGLFGRFLEKYLKQIVENPQNAGKKDREAQTA